MYIRGRNCPRQFRLPQIRTMHEFVYGDMLGRSKEVIINALHGVIKKSNKGFTGFFLIKNAIYLGERNAVVYMEPL